MILFELVFILIELIFTLLGFVIGAAAQLFVFAISVPIYILMGFCEIIGDIASGVYNLSPKKRATVLGLFVLLSLFAGALVTKLLTAQG